MSAFAFLWTGFGRIGPDWQTYPGKSTVTVSHPPPITTTHQLCHNINNIRFISGSISACFDREKRNMQHPGDRTSGSSVHHGRYW